MNMAESRAFPADEIAPEHEAVHAQLEDWGRWNRDRRGRMRLGSAERRCQSRYRDHHYPTYDEMMPVIANPMNLAIDRAVLEVPGGHQLALKLNYVQLAPAWLIVRRCRLRPGGFGRWMHDARCMVINLLRRQGS
jgi:hypothetical protein